jgi:hypothetical protein
MYASTDHDAMKPATIGTCGQNRDECRIAMTTSAEEVASTVLTAFMKARSTSSRTHPRAMEGQVYTDHPALPAAVTPHVRLQHDVNTSTAQTNRMGVERVDAQRSI